MKITQRSTNNWRRCEFASSTSIRKHRVRAKLTPHCFPCLGPPANRGYNIGTRLIEDFLARTNLSKCSDFREVGEVVSKVGFKMFLNITPNVVHHQQEDASSSAAATTPQSAAPSAQATGTASAGTREFSLILDENPLAEFVELPRDARAGGLWFSNVLAGVLRGALEMVQMQTECFFVSDTLRGDDTTELRVRLIKHLDEEAPIADD